MEYKKKTIIWEDNNEPPKDYIWVKADNKAYEFDYKDRKWVESKSLESINASDSDCQYVQKSLEEMTPEEVIKSKYLSATIEGANFPDVYAYSRGLFDYVTGNTLEDLFENLDGGVTLNELDDTVMLCYKEEPTIVGSFTSNGVLVSEAMKSDCRIQIISAGDGIYYSITIFKPEIEL